MLTILSCLPEYVINSLWFYEHGMENDRDNSSTVDMCVEIHGIAYMMSFIV